MFKKNGTLNLGEIQKYSGFSVKFFLSSSKNALDEESMKKFKRKYNIAVLGTLALKNGFSIDDLSKPKDGKR